MKTQLGFLLVTLALVTSCQSAPEPVSTSGLRRTSFTLSSDLSAGQVPSDLRTLLLAAPRESLQFKGHYGRTSMMDKLPEIAKAESPPEPATCVVHVHSELFVVDAALLPTQAPLAVRIEAKACEALMAALIEEGLAQRLHTPELPCNDGQMGYASVIGQYSVVRGFDVKATGSQFITEPDVTTVKDGLRMSVLPASKANDKVSLAITLDSTQLQHPIPTIETKYGIKIQTPTFLNQHLETSAVLAKNEGILIAGIQATDKTRVIIAILRARAQDLSTASR